MRRRRFVTVVLGACATWGLGVAAAGAAPCVACHKQLTPGIVADWQISKHAANEVDCPVCHGEAHQSAADAAKATLPSPDTCGNCHPDQVVQFRKGKHAAAWAAMKAMPTAHAQPAALMEGLKGCGGCHKLGVKSEAELNELRPPGVGFGRAICDACHTRHAFSLAEARQPQACQTCHMGFDHPQWEMYSTSKHGVRFLLRQNKTLPETAAAPACQTCHMPDGDHEVRTAWGFLGVRLSLPEDEQWSADRVTILQALGALDPDGQPTARLDVIKAADVARQSQESWQKERDKMIKICTHCHAPTFAKGELAKGDEMIRSSDHLLAEAIRTVAALYQDGVLPRRPTYDYSFPDLLTFHDAPTVIEQKLFVMHLEHRMRAFQGVFHANPDYALWYGWSALQRDLREIRELAEQMRAAKKAADAEADVQP